MKAIINTFAVSAVLLLGCLLPVAGQVRNIPGHHESGIIGIVDAGQSNGGLVPGLWHVEVISDTGKLVANLETDEQGFFGVDLNPGNYVLTPVDIPNATPGQPVPNIVIVGPPTSVRVAKNRFTFVVLPTRLGTVLPPIPGDRR